MRIKLTSLMVDDQDKALQFYTDVLGFAKRQDFPVGEYRWITVASPDRDDLQLALEPNANPAARTSSRRCSSSASRSPPSSSPTSPPSSRDCAMGALPMSARYHDASRDGSRSGIYARPCGRRVGAHDALGLLVQEHEPRGAST